MAGTKRRPNLNFRLMKIPKGSTLINNETGEEAIVQSERTVIFNDDEVSLTDATKTALGKYGNPCEYWSYKGTSLKYIYDDTYQ